MKLPEEQNILEEIAAGNVEAFEHLFPVPTPVGQFPYRLDAR